MAVCRWFPPRPWRCGCGSRRRVQVLEHLLGHHGQAHARLASAVDVLGDHQSPEAAALMIDLAMDRFAVMDYPIDARVGRTA